MTASQPLPPRDVYQQMRDLIDDWAQDEILPDPVCPPGHPLEVLTDACVNAMRDCLDGFGVDANLRWVSSSQSLEDAPPGLITSCVFEYEYVHPDRVEDLRSLLEAHIDAALGWPNLSVRLECARSRWGEPRREA